MSFIKNIPLRPHHGMCLAYFKGEGYSDGFSAHMQEMLDIFQKGAKIQLHADTDEICSACPNNEKGCCSSFSLVEAYDNAVLELCGLEGRLLGADEIISDSKADVAIDYAPVNAVLETERRKAHTFLEQALYD